MNVHSSIPSIPTQSVVMARFAPDMGSLWSRISEVKSEGKGFRIIDGGGPTHAQLRNAHFYPRNEKQPCLEFIIKLHGIPIEVKVDIDLRMANSNHTGMVWQLAGLLSRCRDSAIGEKPDLEGATVFIPDYNVIHRKGILWLSPWAVRFLERGVSSI